MKRLLPLFLMILFLSSCQNNKVFEQRHNFDDMKWNRFKSITFEFDIKDTESKYDIMMMLRHHTVYAEPDLRLTLALYTPSGERRLKDVILPIRNADGSFRSSGMGDLWDLEQVAFSGYSFNEKGHYKLEIENRMDKFDTPGVMEFGIKIVKRDE
jgi:gliding motility-associated lipoprotein GldH